MRDVSGVEISTVIGCGDRRGIEILEQLKINFFEIPKLTALVLQPTGWEPVNIQSLVRGNFLCSPRVLRGITKLRPQILQDK